MAAPSPADQARRRQSPPGPDEGEERRRRRRPSAERCTRDRTGDRRANWRGSSGGDVAPAGARRRASTGGRAAVASATSSRLVDVRGRVGADRERRSRGTSARPRRRGPGTRSSTSWAVYQKTVPKAKKIVVARRTDGLTGKRPSVHQQIATSTAARTVKSSWSSVGEAPDRDERHEHQGRQRRERQQPAGTPSDVAIGRTSWK